MGFPRWEYWSGLPFPSPGDDQPDPGIKPTSSALAGRLSTTEPPGKPDLTFTTYLMDFLSIRKARLWNPWPSIYWVPIILKTVTECLLCLKHYTEAAANAGLGSSPRAYRGSTTQHKFWMRTEVNLALPRETIESRQSINLLWTSISLSVNGDNNTSWKCGNLWFTNAHRPLGRTLMISMSSVKMNNCFCYNLVGNIHIYTYSLIIWWSRKRAGEYETTWLLGFRQKPSN